MPEFACALDLDAATSLDVGCQRFLARRREPGTGVVHPLPRADRVVRTRRHGRLADVRPVTRLVNACEVAASFKLNEQWQFDAEAFRSAVESIDR